MKCSTFPPLITIGKCLSHIIVQYNHLYICVLYFTAEWYNKCKISWSHTMQVGNMRKEFHILFIMFTFLTYEDLVQ